MGLSFLKFVKRVDLDAWTDPFHVVGLHVVAAKPFSPWLTPPIGQEGPPGVRPRVGFSNVNGSKTHMYEDDIILTQEQHEILFGGIDALGKTKRKAWKGERFRWTNNTVPYFFNGDDFSEHQKNEIREAMDVYEAETCLKFRPATSSDFNKVRFQQGAGCNSQLGMVGGTQELNLDDAGCRWKGLYWHEINHAIGMIHEHQQPDRDEYLKVTWGNVNPSYYSAFTKYKISELERFGIPYDLTSIMHYEVKAFSQSGGQTIIPRDRSKEPWIGHVWISQMSFTDVMFINKMYKCAANCSPIDCKGGFVNKECKCVTPESYYNSHCLNEHPDEEECYERAHKGECDVHYWLNFKCRKACNRCAMYGMDHLIKGKQGDCFNQYFDDAKCDAWAKAGDCEKYPSWMKRQCKKSCGTCNSDWGQCLNMEFDHSCDNWAEMGECDRNPEWMKNRCPDSCKSCGFITRGKCDNVHPNEAECFKWSREGQCVDDDLTRAFWMRKNCGASCNSCDFGQGQCENELDDLKCDTMAYKAECSTKPRVALKQCKKSCNSCDYGVRGNCKNLYETMYGDDQSCNKWADVGSCKYNSGWFLVFCASSCNKCDESKDLTTNCRDLLEEQKCQQWLQSGECDNNPTFMRYNCAKTCRACHLLTSEKICTDIAGKFKCDYWSEAGECDTNPAMMSVNCRLTCGKCQPGEKVVVEAAWPECENISPEASCEGWALRGECDANKRWMLRNCNKHCNRKCEGFVTKQPEISATIDPESYCKDKHTDCDYWRRSGQCESSPRIMQRDCHKSCNPKLCGSPVVFCSDADEDCSDWAKHGHCDLNPTTKILCPKSCGMCT